MASEAEIAWAAGLFEGEGCFCIYPSGGKTYVRAQLGMSDGDVVSRFAAIVGMGTIRRRERQRENWSAIYEWSLKESRGVERLVHMLLPWFGERRTAKAHEALEVLSHVSQAAKNRTHCLRGHLYEESNVRYETDGTHSWKRCRACCREAAVQARQRRLARLTAEREKAVAA